MKKRLKKKIEKARDEIFYAGNPSPMVTMATLYWWRRFSKRNLKIEVKK